MAKRDKGRRAGEIGPDGSPPELVRMLGTLFRRLKDGKARMPVVEDPGLEFDAVLYVRKIPAGKRTD